MGYMKRQLENLSIEMGFRGEITDEVFDEAARRQAPKEEKKLEKALAELAKKKKQEENVSS